MLAGLRVPSEVGSVAQPNKVYFWFLPLSEADRVALTYLRLYDLEHVASRITTEEERGLHTHTGCFLRVKPISASHYIHLHPVFGFQSPDVTSTYIMLSYSHNLTVRETNQIRINEH